MHHEIETARDEARTISCPFCARRYRLPTTLIGSGGARIRCPRCSGAFVLRIERAQPAQARPVEAAAEVGAARSDRPRLDLDSLADQVVATLARDMGEPLADAHARGRLFAEFGPPLLDAFEAYRREAGPEADPAPFRRALERRCHVDLLGESASRADG